MTANDFHVEGIVYSQPGFPPQISDIRIYGDPGTGNRTISGATLSQLTPEKWFFTADFVTDGLITYCQWIHFGIGFVVDSRNIVVDLNGWWTMDGAPLPGAYAPITGFWVDDQGAIRPGKQTLRLFNDSGMDLDLTGLELALLDRKVPLANMSRESLGRLGEVSPDYPSLEWFPVAGFPRTLRAGQTLDVWLEDVGLSIPMGWFLLVRGQQVQFGQVPGDWGWFYEQHEACDIALPTPTATPPPTHTAVPPSATPTVQPSSTPSLTPVPSFTATPRPTATPAPPTATPAPTHIPGDVDGDGVITTSDALIAFRIALGLYVPTPEEEAAADVDGQPGVTTSDALCIFREVLGIPNPCFPSALAGERARSRGAPLGALDAAGEDRIALGRLRLEGRGILVVPVVLANRTRDVRDVQFELAYDPLRLRPLRPGFRAGAATGSWPIMADNIIRPGLLRVGALTWLAPIRRGAGGVLGAVHFEILAPRDRRSLPGAQELGLKLLAPEGGIRGFRVAP
jgi:hypothetical protein